MIGPAEAGHYVLTLAAIILATTGVFTQAGGGSQSSRWEQLPRRIVSIVPAATEMLFAMGAGSRVAGVSNYDRFPPEVASLPKVGGLLDPNIEQLLALRADLVVVYETQTDLKARLERAGVPIFRYAHEGLADIPRTMRELGERVGAKPGADAAAARFEQQLAATQARVAGRPRPRTLLVFGRDPGTLRRVSASGGLGFLHDMLVLAGGADVLGDLRAQSVDMTSEMILARAPEVIIELRYGDVTGRAPVESERRVWNALASVPAVRTNRVYLLTGDEFVVPGPRIAMAAERLAQALHPEVYR